MMRSSFIRGGLILLALGFLGCGRSPRVNFYTLQPGPEPQVAAGSPSPAVVVGPVTLPEVVDRPQLVVRVDANRVEILETHRWAEPLKSELPRLVARDLGRLLGSTRVTSYQQFAGVEAEYRVLLDIVRFESVPGDAVTVEANWTIRRGGAGGMKTGGALKREKISGPGYDNLVAAYSRAVAALSADLAAAIRAEEQSRLQAPQSTDAAPAKKTLPAPHR